MIVLACNSSFATAEPISCDMMEFRNLNLNFHNASFYKHRVFVFSSSFNLLAALTSNRACANTETTMDSFFRVEKPVANRPPLPKKSSSPATHPVPQRPKLNEWADIVSEQAANIDVSTLSDDEMEQVLRLFDLNPAFGPFVGIDRDFRWHRAHSSGLHPPELVKRIIDSGRVVQQREAGQLW